MAWWNGCQLLANIYVLNYSLDGPGPLTRRANRPWPKQPLNFRVHGMRPISSMNDCDLGRPVHSP